MGCCPVERRKLVRHETLDLATGASKPVSEEWVTEACNTPLFGDRARGICNGCASGWTHEHNYPTDNGKAAIEAALAAERIAAKVKKVNRTRYKSLDKLAADPRIVEVWDEDDDGLWALLADGYNIDGCSCLHEWTVKKLLAQVPFITEGPPY